MFDPKQGEKASKRVRAVGVFSRWYGERDERGRTRGSGGEFASDRVKCRVCKLHDAYGVELKFDF